MTTTTPPDQATTDVTSWLAAFGDALTAQDPAAAAGLFTEDCFWRDLIAFTWNIRTFEGRAEIAGLVAATMSGAQPFGWKISDGEQPVEADGVTEAWIDFETAAGRGQGHVRLRDGRCWTLLTTLCELRGHEEPQGRLRPHGVEHGANRGRTTWLEDRERESGALGGYEQPYVLVVGGGRPGSRSARGFASSACPRSSWTSAAAPATSGAAGTRRSACTTRCGTTTCRT